MKVSNNNIARRTLWSAAAAVVAFSAAGSFAVPMFAAAASEPHTYENLGVDRAAKDDFEKKTAAKTKLPVINVTTRNNSEYILSKEVYTDCVVDVFNADPSMELDEVSAGIKVRGNSSAYYGDEEMIKKNPVPYRIKFDSKQSMLGLNGGAECKSWVLLKSDWNLCANDLAFRMGRELFDDTAYCSDSRFVHLYVNDKLQGTYVLCEQSQVNKHRVNITEPEEGYEGTDIGYYLELDNYADEPGNVWFSMDYEGATVTDVRGTTRQFVPAEYTIKNDVYSDAQAQFIDKYLNNVFELIYKACEKGEFLALDENNDLVPSGYTTAEETVCAAVDIESIVDMYLLYEIVHDNDCGEGSFYMCADFGKDGDVKLQFTSPWDFNWAYGDSTERYWAGAFCTQSFANSYGDRSNPWFILLAKQDWFKELCTEKWTAESANVKNCLKSERAILNAYEDDLNAKEQYGTSSASSLINWVEKRLKWMDRTFKVQKPDPEPEPEPTPEPTPTPTPHPNTTSITRAKISIKSNVCTYLGKTRRPAVTVTMNGRKLNKDTDYTVTYKNSLNPGKASYTVTGKGKYSGKVTKYFYIVPKQAELKSLVSPKRGQVKLTWKRDKLADGYQINLALDKQFTKGKKRYFTANNTTLSRTVTKLKKGKKYYARVRSYKTIGGKKYYGKYSSVRAVRCK